MSDELEVYSTMPKRENNIDEKLIIRQLAKFIYMYMMRTRDKEIARIFMVEDRL